MPLVDKRERGKRGKEWKREKSVKEWAIESDWMNEKEVKVWKRMSKREKCESKNEID